MAGRPRPAAIATLLRHSPDFPRGSGIAVVPAVWPQSRLFALLRPVFGAGTPWLGRVGPGPEQPRRPVRQDKARTIWPNAQERRPAAAAAAQPPGRDHVPRRPRVPGGTDVHPGLLHFPRPERRYMPPGHGVDRSGADNRMLPPAGAGCEAGVLSGPPRWVGGCLSAGPMQKPAGRDSARSAGVSAPSGPLQEPPPASGSGQNAGSRSH